MIAIGEPTKLRAEQTSWTNYGFNSHYKLSLLLSVYLPVKRKGILDTVNRLPVDVAEPWSTVRKGKG